MLGKQSSCYAVLFAACFAALNAHATFRTWLGSASNNDTRWSLANNWVIGPPTPGDDLVFPVGASHPNNDNDFPTGTIFNSITIGGNNYVLNGSSIALNAGILVTNNGNVATINIPFILNSNQTFMVLGTSAGLNLGGAIDINGKELTFNVTSPAVAQVMPVISGVGALVKAGTGILILSNNTFTGKTTISNGTLRVIGSQPNSPITVYGGALGGIGTVGTVTASGPGAKYLDPGTGVGILNSSNVLLDANTTLLLQLNGATPGTGYDQLNVAGSVNLGGAALSLTFGFTPTAINSFTVINNNGNDPVVGTFNGLPEGTTFTNSGVPLRITYAGGDGNDVVVNVVGVTRVWSGAGSNNLWTNAANWVGGIAPSPADDLVFPPGVASANGSNNFPAGTIFNSITISGGGYVLYGSSIFLNGGINASNTPLATSVEIPITLLSDQAITSGNSGVNLYLYSDIETSGKDLTLAGNGIIQLQSSIKGSGGLVKTGAGTVSMYVSNSFSGPAQIRQGSVSLYQGNALGSPDGSTTVFSNATLNVLNGISIPEPLILAGNLTVLGGTNFLTSPINLAASNNVFQIGGNAALIVNAIISGGGSLTKSSFGTLILNSNNTYSGGTILTNGTLGGNGRIGTLTASGVSTQKLAPGASPGILSCSNVTLNIYSTYAIELNGTNAGTSYDQLNVNGSVALNNAVLSLTLGYTPAAGDSFVIVNNDAADAVTGTFSGLPSGALITNGATIFRIAYDGGDGNDVTLTTTLGAPAAMITAITNLPDASKQLTGQGLSNLNYAIQGATNLNPPITWSNLGKASANGSGIFQFTDTNASLYPARFYRVASP